MDEISFMLQKIRTLAVQPTNGTNTADDCTSLTKEEKSLTDKMTRIAKKPSMMASRF